MEMFEKKTTVKICAPMVRYSKVAFRNLVRHYGCDVAFSPMILADSFYSSQKARDSEFVTSEEDSPLIVQFAAKNAHHFSESAVLVSEFCNGVDLNCGCPQRWAIQEGIGACLINKPEFVSEVVKETRRKISKTGFSVSVKIRIHDDVRRTVDLCRQVQAAGVSFITVHGRTKDQRAEPVNLPAITTIRQSLDVPVVANGDVRSLSDVERVTAATGCHGVMAARGLLENPAMFAGYHITPVQCVSDWVYLALSTGTPFTTFHHHLIYMLEKSLHRGERRLFNSLSSTTAVVDFLRDHMDLPIQNELSTRGRDDAGYGQSELLIDLS